MCCVAKTFEIVTSQIALQIIESNKNIVFVSPIWNLGQVKKAH